MKAPILRLTAAAAVFAAASLFAASPTAADYPDADAVIVDGLEEVFYAPDGTNERVSTSVVKILTEKGRREESNIELSYSARYGSAEIVEVSVTGADGETRKIDVSATTSESTDNSSVSENIYDPMHRKIVCTVPGLKVGDTLRCKTSRKMLKPRVENLFADLSVLEWSCPMIRQTYRVHAPKELPLAKTALRNPLGNVAYRTAAEPGGATLHEWTATASPQAFEEPDAPPFYTLVQNVRVSTAAGWPEISRWYWNLCVPHLAKTTPGMTNTVVAILGALPSGASDGDRIAAVFKWVSQEIRYMGLTLEDTSPGYAPHDVSLTYENRYGVCRDKAALLAAMLRMASFDAYPVLIHAGAKMDPEVPMPYFNHAIVAVRAPGAPGANADGFILMDPTNESTADIFPAYLGDKSYLVATPEGEPLHVSQVYPASRNAVTVRSTGTLEEGGSLAVESRISFSGIDDNAYRTAFLRRKPEERRRIFGNILRNLCGSADLVSFELEPKDLRDTTKPLAAKLTFRTRDAAIEGGTRTEFTVPFLSRALGSANWMLSGNTSLDKRRFPLVVDSTAMVDEKVEIALGDGFSGDPALPEDDSIEGPYSFSRTYSVRDGRLSATRRLSVDAVEFSPAEYLDVRENIKRVEASDRKRPVFARDALAGADVRILRSDSFCRVFSPYSWVATNTVSKEILTYDGKKRSSELKFAYNPAWKKVEVVSASVSNRNGKVSYALDRERTELDASWAASAPRYPASKTLVVNLPSVEIGSVVTYVVATTVDSSPAPFRSAWRFDSMEPADCISLDYADWTGARRTRREVSPARVPGEPMQPDPSLWRDEILVSHGDFAAAAERLRKATRVEPVRAAEALGEAARADSPEAALAALRDWMAKHVRVAGPSLYEVPLEAQTTPPETVLKERYATRLDYVRTFCALAKGAGFDADIVFAADDARENPILSARDVSEYPDVAKFSVALCRVRVKKGGFLGFGGETVEYIVGTENEYTPVGFSPYASSRYLDPENPESVGGAVLPPAAPGAESAEKTEIAIHVRENGSIDVDYVRETRGPETGAFRKMYSEMLPEDRSRHFQTLLGGLSNAASATRELLTDVESYPARLSFSAYIPDFAVVSGDSVSITVPWIGGGFLRLPEGRRKTPVGVPARRDASSKVVRIVFPKGYGKFEHVPEKCVFADPSGGDGAWRVFEVEKRVNGDGAAEVELVETFAPRCETLLSPDCAALLREWSEEASSRAGRTIVVRKGR